MNVFKDEIKIFFDDDKDNWKKKSFLLHDELQNIIGKVEISISMTRKRKSLSKTEPEKSISENVNPNISQSQLKDKLQGFTGKPSSQISEKVEKEIQTSVDESEHFTNTPHKSSTISKFKSNAFNKTAQDGFNKTAQATTKKPTFSKTTTNPISNRPKSAVFSNPKKILNPTPELELDSTSILIDNPSNSFKAMLEGYYCPPVITLTKVKIIVFIIKTFFRK